MSKFGGRALSEALSMELSGTQVHVMIIHPGGVKTNIIKNAPDLADSQREDAHQVFTKAAFLTPEVTAQKILRGIRKKRSRMVIGVDAKIAYTIRRLFPRLYPRILNFFFGQMTFK
jgi:short-subunit dehydrogenase